MHICMLPAVKRMGTKTRSNAVIYVASSELYLLHQTMNTLVRPSNSIVVLVRRWPSYSKVLTSVENRAERNEQAETFWGLILEKKKARWRRGSRHILSMNVCIPCSYSIDGANTK